jgi:hypothetical protein
MSPSLLTLKNLEDFHVWPIKHRHWTFEVIEDEFHNIWLRTHDLRGFYEKFPKDKELTVTHRSAMLYAKDIKAYYLSERAMGLELRRSKSHSSHNDVLKFLDWFDRNVTQVAAKKRGNTHQTKLNHHRQLHEQKISDGPVPANRVSPQLEAITVPFTPEERWAMERESNQARRVYHHEARPFRTTWKDWAHGHASVRMDYLLSFWRGERNLFLTFGVAMLVAYMPQWILNLLVPNSLDWTSSYRRVMWAFALVVPIALICSIVYTVAMSRSTRHAWRVPGGKLWATTFYLLVIPIGPMIFFVNYDSEMVEYWWANVRGNYHPMEIYADPHLGRIVTRGAMQFGSADALQQALERSPHYTLIQIESPGGFVIEGMRMAQIVAKHKLDTVSMERCASACTFVLAAGVDRYLGPNVNVGFHRSGSKYGSVGDGWNDTDYKIAKYYRDRGVDEEFVEKALTPSIREIWFAPHEDMYAAGYANLRWDERKSGY